MKRGSISGLHTRLAALAILFVAGGAHSTTQETISPLPEVQIREVTSRLLKEADKANCKPSDCRVAVANFTFASGLTSSLGLELADAFAQELSSQGNTLTVVDRSQFRSDLERQRIPGEVLREDNAMRWLGHAVGATSILRGTIEQAGSSIRVSIHLLSCERNEAGPQETFTFIHSGPANGLSPVEAFPKNPSSMAKPDDSPEFRAGVGGVTQPACTYCPYPDFTKAAIEASFKGNLVMDVLVSAEGHAAQVTILRGAPFGLNDTGVNVVHRWRFKPSTLHGKPVPAWATIEINLH